MKTKQLQSYLIRLLVIALATMAVCAGFYYILTSYSENLEREISDNEQKKIAADLKKNVIKERVGLSEEAVKFYDVFKTHHGESDKLFRRDTLRNTLLELKQDMLLNNLEFTLQPFEEKGGEFKKENAVLISAKVSMKFTAPSDVVSLKAIKDLQNILPGFIDLVDLRVKKIRDFTPQDIVDISRGASPSIVESELNFNWLGIKDIKASEAAHKITSGPNAQNN